MDNTQVTVYAEFEEGVQTALDGIVILPFKWNDMLDEQLDTATIELDRTTTELIEPLTPITVKITTGRGGNVQTVELNYILATDDSEETPVGSGLYHHMITLVEETKYLEGFVVDSLCVTQPGGNVYTENAYPVTPEEK